MRLWGLFNSSWFLTPLQMWLFALLRAHTRRAVSERTLSRFLLDTSIKALSHTRIPEQVSCRKVPWPGFREATQGPYLVCCTGGSYFHLLYMHSEYYSWRLEMDFCAMITCSLAGSQESFGEICCFPFTQLSTTLPRHVKERRSGSMHS
jgi:hypothetical protein